MRFSHFEYSEDNKREAEREQDIAMQIPSKSCLIVVDMQYDFLPPLGSLAVPGGDLIVSKIHDFILSQSSKFDLIVFTQDYHPQNHISFASNHLGKTVFDSIEYVKKNDEGQNDSIFKSTLWPDHCVQGTRGCEIEKTLLDCVSHVSSSSSSSSSSYPVVKIVQKGYIQDREYYSGFNDIWNNHKTELNDILIENGINNVYLCGLALDYCVFNTALSSRELGYNTFIIRDMSRGIDGEWILNEEKTGIQYV